ncbi:MAG: cysteine synthase family protein [Deltaproteobacteria bacterium]|nr:cysteine synthase family protein [Deltaproteobacteria bacterium]
MDLLQAIGNTPLVELRNLRPNPRVRILCKIEGCNPGGSVKDRPALYMVKRAEERGELTKEKTILEPTSGNTGIALGMIAAHLGYRVELCMPECVSVERRLILEALGCKIFLTPAEENIDGAIRKAFELKEKFPHKYYLPNQYDNPDNVSAHYLTTGPEIMMQTAGDIDFFVAGMGTTGTLMGTGRYLKEKNPQIKIIGIEPVKGHTIQGLKNMGESIVPKIYDRSLIDDLRSVNDNEAFETTKILARCEGIFAGTSSGAALYVAMKIAKEIKNGTIVVILPDRGERYLSLMNLKSISAKYPPQNS